MAALASGKARGLRFEIDLGSATSKSGRLQAHECMNVLVVADCSGRGARGVMAPLAGRRARSIGVDNLEAAFAAWGAEIDVEFAGLTASLRPRALEDLHPDQLLRDVAPLRDFVGSDTPHPGSEPQSGQPGNADLLERLLGTPPAGAAARSTSPATSDAAKSVVDRLIRGAVADAGLQAPSSVQQARGPAAELELARSLRALLHDPAFRSLESTWLAIDGLCRSCPDDELVRYRVVDASWAEVLADLDGFGALLEVERPSVVVMDHYVGPSVEALGALQALLRTCAARGAILAIGASPGLAGYSSFSASAVPPDEVTAPAAATDAWQQLAQARAGGAQLALVLPRYLLRQPYGKLGESIAQLEFEEVPSGDHEAFPWGNGAYLAARALAELHSAGGPQLDGSVELSDLPVVRLRGEDGYHLQPSAEAWLSEHAVERLRAAGFAVLQGVRDSDRLRVHL